MSEVRVPNPLVEQFKRGGVAADLRLMAAQGALPLGPLDLLELLHHLLSDEDEGVRQTAAKTMAELPSDHLLPIGKDRATPPPLLAWMLASRTEPDLLEGVLQNTSLTDATVEAHAPRLNTELAELVVINQVRLLRRTSLLVAIEANPNLNNDQKRRLYELRETFKIGGEVTAEPSPAKPEASPAEAPAAVPAAEPEAAEDIAALSEEQAVARYLTVDEQGEKEKVSAVQRLYRMNTVEKIITALKGNREERAVLVRDPNRLVATAVLGSPRVTGAEIESFAGMKNVSAEILRTIGNHREWTKKYNVVANLVRNPRTPLAISIGMVSRLNPRDLKGIAVDRNVPEVIRKQAQRFVRTPQQAGGGSGRH
jgi:hypothetical protein